MQEIGRVKLVQVQQSSLKVGQRLAEYYDPSPLVVVKSLLISHKGAVGITDTGAQILDVHNVDHLQTRHRKRKNTLSLGFTSHYQAMRERFGDHLEDGIAGENILVESERSFTLADLGESLAIQSRASGQVVYLTHLVVAAPCEEFSTFAANYGMPLPAEVLKSTLQFLDKGRRGFYASVADEHAQVSIAAGDPVFLVSTRDATTL